MSDTQTVGRSLRFFVVEDDDDHAELIMHVIREHGSKHSAKRVADGKAALDALFALKSQPKRSWPDLVLLDLQLPKVDGLDVLDRLKQDDVLRSIPVVVLTTSDAEVDRSKAYHQYANSYVVKPVSYEKFERLIRDLSAYWGGWDQGV